MNRAALNKAGLTLRILPPLADHQIFPLPSDYQDTLSALQKLRGAIYVDDKAISPDSLDSEGRHRSDDDEQSYHLTISNGHIQGCLRTRPYSVNRQLESYRVYELIKRMRSENSSRYREGLEQFIQIWSQKGYKLGETGGWAVSKSFQFKAAALCLPLAGWSFARICTKQVWIASATEKNGSAEMLRRIGGWRLKLDERELPPFFDPYYNCQMELICFCSEVLDPRFESFVQDLQSLLEEQSASKRVYCGPNKI